MALRALITLGLIAVRDQNGEPREVEDTTNDESGGDTVNALNRMISITRRVTGNDSGSLGLHPAVYFYGPTGQHSDPMFMGTMILIAKKLANNDKDFFRKFTAVRPELEDILVNHKDTIAMIIQKPRSPQRADSYAALLDELITQLTKGSSVDDASLVAISGLDGKIVTGSAKTETARFSDDTKSKAFISQALAGALKCSVCGGYLNTQRSVSYDHNVPVRDGGTGREDNLRLTHPYCNQSIKQ